MLAGEKSRSENFLVKLFAVVPLLAVAAAVPLAWGWGLSWVDVALAAFFYFFTCLGVTVGFHRYFTHGAFKAKRALRVGARGRGQHGHAGPASSAGSPITAATTPSPTRRATRTRRGCSARRPAALAKGFWHAHMGWMFDRDKTNPRRFAPDLLADRDIARVDTLFPVLTVVTLLAARRWSAA